MPSVDASSRKFGPTRRLDHESPHIDSVASERHGRTDDQETVLVERALEAVEHGDAFRSSAHRGVRPRDLGRIRRGDDHPFEVGGSIVEMCTSVRSNTARWSSLSSVILQGRYSGSMSETIDWTELSARAGRAGHDLVGWLMWDAAAIERYAQLGVANGAGWIVAWRLAPLGDVSPAAASSATYSISPDVIGFVMSLYRDVTDQAGIAAVRDASILPGLESIAPGLADQLAPLADDLWRAVDSAHFGARPMFSAFRAEPRPDSTQPALSAWLAANCLRELRGDNHWALCAAADLDAVEVGLLHSAMVDVDEYGDEEWIARSRGNDDDAIANGWARLNAKGFADGTALNEAGREFRLDLERRTDDLTAPAWQAAGEATTVSFCNAIEPHHDAFLARINATAGERWMPALRHR